MFTLPAISFRNPDGCFVVLTDATIARHMSQNCHTNFQVLFPPVTTSFKCDKMISNIHISGGYCMKVLVVNGSPRINGNTSIAIAEMEQIFKEEGIETETVQLGVMDIRGCIACLDRLFYSSHSDKTMKVGASIAVARRGGCSSTFDELNKYFTICGMPVASSQYWNSVHGAGKRDAAKDAEGLQTMRVLARNMAFLMKSIALGKEKYGLPEKEELQHTNFIR